MYHMRRCTAAEWAIWAQTREEDLAAGTSITRAATTQELLNRGVVVEHTDAATGDVYFHVGSLSPDGWPGVALTPTSGPECYLARRYRALPAEHRARFYRARVFRSLDGSNFRTSCEAAVAANLAARTPATGRTSSEPADPAGALTVLEEARRRATPEIDPATGQVTRAATAHALSVPMVEVTSADVVEEDILIGHRWAGEPDE